MKAQRPLTSTEIRSRFLAFFAKRGHAVIDSASLVTPDEKGITNPTLFNTAGMQPLIPYLLGKPYLVQGQKSTRLVDSQKCIRTVDIDEVGDKTHATFFEMLGNWSLGDYFKKEAITWSYEFLTNSSEAALGDQGLGLDPKRLYVTVFAGDTNSPKDTEAASVWESVGMPKNRIYFKDAASNWWPAVKPGKEDGWTGPTGPCSEMFYDITEAGLSDLSPEDFEKADEEQTVVEIWNDVFIEFEKKEGTIVGKLAQKNVDTGAGLERLTAVFQNVDNIFDTDLLKPIVDIVKEFANKESWNMTSARIIADHVRAAVFLIGDGITPSNTDRGYVLRKLLRRAISHAHRLEIKIPGSESALVYLGREVVKEYKHVYGELEKNQSKILAEIHQEEEKFRLTLEKGIKEFEKGVDAFTLFSSYGFPLELTLELAKEKGVDIDVAGFEEKFKKHQDLSRAGAEQKFKGGLADANDPVVVRYHTATHLLHQALHDVLDKPGENGVEQKGSNITAERLRFDFSYPQKMTDEQKKRVEDIVNEKISAKLPVNHIVMSRAEAEKTGARHLFNEKYGDEVSIYYVVGDTAHPDVEHAYSKEFCGGPHVKNTDELAGPEGNARFKIQKEEAVSQGVRRIKAVLA